MRKQLIVIAVLMAVVVLSGCNSSDYTSNFNECWDELSSFEDEIRNIGKDIDSYSEVINYNLNKFIKHKNQLNSYDFSYCDSSGEYKRLRDYCINGLNYLVGKNYKNAWSSFLKVDDTVLNVSPYGDMWCNSYGYEDGVCDVLYDNWSDDWK